MKQEAIMGSANAASVTGAGPTSILSRQVRISFSPCQAFDAEPL
jgi:hypothetical protein